MTVERIDTKRGREALAARREPYWQKLSKGRYLGIRKLPNGGAAWIARFRNDEGAQQYNALGEVTDVFGFDQAKDAAESWMRNAERGVSDRHEDGRRVTVESACLAYVRTRRAEGRLGAAHDAHMRFRRTIYGDTADEELGLPARPAVMTAEAQAPRVADGDARESSRKRRKWQPIAHPIAATPLAKIRAPRIKQWHLDLVAGGLSKASANRTLSALKAALNLAVADRTVSAAMAQEWAEVAPLKDAARRRDLFLDVTQRRKLLANSKGGIRRLLEAVMHTGCRAGELTSARRSAFDARTKSLNVTGKTGSRTIPLTPASVALFAQFAKDKMPTAFLLTRDDGTPWAHSSWDVLVKEAAARAELPPQTCLYTLRHSFITQALLDGVSTLEVTKIVGTSLAMIEKHYGHLVADTARARLAKVQLV
jgi:integrase